MHSRHAMDGTPPHDYNSDIEIAPCERKEKLTSKSVSPPKNYIKLLIPFLLVFTILTTNNNCQVTKLAPSIVFRRNVEDNSTNDSRFALEHGGRHDNNIVSLPNILLIGAQNSAINPIAYTLFQKCGICHMEGHLFDRTHRLQQSHSRRLEHCKEKNESGSSMALDASPEYLIGKDVPHRVRQAYDSVGQTENLKILLVLREPVAREHSMYKHMVREFRKEEHSSWTNSVARTKRNQNGSVTTTIMDFPEFVENAALSSVMNGTNHGLYSQHLKNWLESFDRKQVLVLSYDEFIQDTVTFFGRVLDFLALDENVGQELNDILAKNKETTKKVVTPPECSAQTQLANAFTKSNEELYALLEFQPGPAMEQRPFPKFQLGSCHGANNQSSKIENDSILSTNTNGHQTLRLPNALLIGAQKAGTSALAETLFSEVGVCCAQRFEGDLDYYGKEVNFFNKRSRFEQGLEFYSKRYEHCNAKQVAMDATVDYLSGPNSVHVAERVRKAYDSVGQAEKLKIIAVLREPVVRELSMYNMIVRAYLDGDRSPWARGVTKEESNGGGATIMNFNEFVDKVALASIEDGRSFGLYAKQLKKWFDRFDRKQILILSYDEFVEDEAAFFQRVLQFLDLGTEKTKIHANEANAQNHATKVSRPECVTQTRLASAFNSGNEELYALLESHLGPPMEQRPFPRFQLGNCSAR